MTTYDVIQPQYYTSSAHSSSPCGRFQLEIQSYSKPAPSWSYSRILVRRGEEVIASVDRNYGFRGGFFQRGTETWFWTGRHYQTQLLVNLETGQHHEYQGVPIEYATFCWTGLQASASGKLLAVDGCVWACPYELRFYDLSQPDKGWPEIPLAPNEHVKWLEVDSGEWRWEGETLHYRSYVDWNTRLDKAVHDLSYDELIKGEETEERDLLLLEFQLLDGRMALTKHWESDLSLALRENSESSE